MKGNMTKNKDAYGLRKRPLSETISKLKSCYRKVRYIIVDTPSFCKDLFSLKCNQLTMRDCAIKNFAIQYIDINSRTAQEIADNAAANEDLETCKQYKTIADVMQMYVADLESRKQFLVKQKGMSDKEVAEATARHPSLFKKEEDMEAYAKQRKLVSGYANQITDEVIEAINEPGGFNNIESAVESSLYDMYEEIKK